jgi:hypothetical protein
MVNRSRKPFILLATVALFGSTLASSISAAAVGCAPGMYSRVSHTFYYLDL